MNVRALKVGLRITEVPSFEYKRIHAHSNLNAVRDGTLVLQMILKQGFDGKHITGSDVASQVKRDEFGPAMRLLLQEAVHLARRRRSLSSSAYRNTVESIKAASKTLLTMPCNDPYI